MQTRAKSRPQTRSSPGRIAKMGKPTRRRSTKPKVAPPKSKSPFIELPPEIRNNIYELLLVSASCIPPNVPSIFNRVESQENSGIPFLKLQHEHTLALARTCSQLHDEAIAVYFGRNEFFFINTYNLYVFLYMIGEQRRRCIRSIDVMYLGLRQREAFELLGECVSLRKLIVTISQYTTKHTKQPQRDLWRARGMSALRNIRGLHQLELSISKFGVQVKLENGTITQSSWFNEDHIRNFQETLLKEMTSEKIQSKEELLAEQKKLEKREAKEKSLGRQRISNESEWKKFQEKKTKRIEERAADSGLSGEKNMVDSR